MSSLAIAPAFAYSGNVVPEKYLYKGEEFHRLDDITADVCPLLCTHHAFICPLTLPKNFLFSATCKQQSSVSVEFLKEWMMRM
jgi:hypothetical protein